MVELEYPPNCDSAANITTDCLPSCNTILGENTECYPLCEEGMDITIECSTYNTPINTVPILGPQEPNKIVVFIQPDPIIEISYLETTKQTSYIEYQEAYEYVIDQSQEGFFLYAIFECSNEIVNLRYPFEDDQIERSNLGLISVITDIVIMSIFLLTLWCISYLVK